MNAALNHTHDAGARSWVATANTAGSDFPIQNLPYAVFRRTGSPEPFRGGVAIGNQVLDMAALSARQLLDGLALDAARAAARPALNDFFALGGAAWRALRHAVFALLRDDAPPATVHAVRECLVPQAEVEYTVPARIGDYTDFYTSIDHALNISRLMNPEGDVTPNFRWIPTAYHGRVSTIGISGQRFHRPMGQTMAPGARAPTYHACARLDYELELGIWIGEGNAAGEPIPLERAEEHIFGICLLNDWSARDIQFWEMAPLGPFLAKNFATTLSPWIVTMEALAPYRQAWTRPANEPQPLGYLDSHANRESGAIDIRLEVWLESEKARSDGSGPSRLSRTSFRHQYWSVAQMVAHHTVGGCSLNPGDLFGSGTISGPGPGEAGAIIELTRAAQDPVTLANGEQRGFLEDGDAVLLRGWCEKPGHARIGFGESRGMVLPAKG
ncbi:fumarylacetoacetase [Variovorax paradoxus]|uniref:fumarylacetoacetase n=1 Tax=Variovorax paradoxus TaxID=34073 RepID=A0A0H2MN27_VARPD|nr:fumarylacetoacetase [Variovorax paradoxus]KLN58135.1 fumarylacetoacetate (FAA) hydrolase family protein [Variovorax paradoxus]